MYCHRMDPDSSGLGGDRAAMVWFSDELTPRLEWTWHNFHFSGSIRVYCRRYCKCATERDQETRSTPDPIFPVGHGVIVTLDDGSIQLSSTSNIGNSRPSESFTLFPSQANGPTSGTCGEDHKQFCQQPWPEDVLGPIPRSPPTSNDQSYHDPLIRCLRQVATVHKNLGSIPVQAWVACQAKASRLLSLSFPERISPKIDNQACKASCSKAKDCSIASTTSCSYRSVCLIDPTTMKEQVLGTLSKTAIFYAAGSCLRQHTRPKLRRRYNAAAFERDTDDASGWPCACNASYISHACCDAGDQGLVWEEQTLALGQLEV